MRILMTGATSYLGHRCVPRLQAADHEVIALTREGTSMEAVRALGVASCAWDAAPDADLLIHLSTFYSGQTLPGQHAEIVRANVEKPSLLVERFLARGGTRVVAAGTCWESCGSDLRPANLYAASKGAFRELAAALCIEHGCSLVWLRFTDMIGIDDPRARLFQAIRDSLAQDVPLPMTKGEQPFDPVWIDDAAAAVVAAVGSATDAPLQDVSIAGGEPQSLRLKVQQIFDRRSRSDLPQWGARSYRRGEPFMVRWRPPPDWWRPHESYASILERMFPT